jgi:hypothetical protein
MTTVDLRVYRANRIQLSYCLFTLLDLFDLYD